MKVIKTENNGQVTYRVNLGVVDGVKGAGVVAGKTVVSTAKGVGRGAKWIGKKVVSPFRRNKETGAAVDLDAAQPAS